jgi:peptide deformylase
LDKSTLKLSSDKSLLFKECEDWDFKNPPMDISDLGKNMISLLYEAKGLGLAANQVGLPYKIFVMRGSKENYCCINPKIVNLSVDRENGVESCLSFPCLIIKKERSKEVRLRFQGPNGQTYTHQFTGLTARVVQHEMDHLTGLPFWQNISRIKFDMAVRKAKKLGFDYSNVPWKGL